MKKIILAIALSVVSVAQLNAQTLKDLLNSSTVNNALTSITGGKELNAKNISGTWSYTKPAVEFKGNNALKNVAGSVASTEFSNKLGEYFTKIGITEGALSYTFNNDDTFTTNILKQNLKGSYAINSEEKSITLTYSVAGKLNLFKIKALVTISSNSLSLLFNVDDLLEFLTKVSSNVNNKTFSSLNTLLSQYDGMRLGFELKK